MSVAAVVVAVAAAVAAAITLAIAAVVQSSCNNSDSRCGAAAAAAGIRVLALRQVAFGIGDCCRCARSWFRSSGPWCGVKRLGLRDHH